MDHYIFIFSVRFKWYFFSKECNVLIVDGHQTTGFNQINNTNKVSHLLFTSDKLTTSGYTSIANNQKVNMVKYQNE